MREIKFRAWNEIIQDWEPDNEETTAVSSNGEIMVINCNVVLVRNLSNLIICQYTELKDMNDMEIYDQDKLYHAHADEFGHVEYDEGCYYAVFGNVETQLSEICDEVEVVGSILEKSDQTEG